ncbi:MAG: hypothetical protein MUP97_14225 [Acidimicrobiia bacterium]|nr:hypothetical protein [Acidimicrobiia bacterium]
MGEDEQTTEFNLESVETEFRRLPDVVAARIVPDDVGRPVEIHVLAHTGKHPKQVVRDVQSVALASFGLEIDRRIVSVVQLGPNGSEAAAPGAPAPVKRVQIAAIETSTAGLRASVRVTLSYGDAEATGFAEGAIAAATRPRLVASATIDALRQLEPAAERLDVAGAEFTRVGGADLAVTTLVLVEPPLERQLAGSAIVHHLGDDAVVRSVLDAVNRRLPFLAADRDDS